MDLDTVEFSPVKLKFFICFSLKGPYNCGLTFNVCPLKIRGHSGPEIIFKASAGPGQDVQKV